MVNKVKYGDSVNMRFTETFLTVNVEIFLE